jgi:hypothetical protein
MQMEQPLLAQGSERPRSPLGAAEGLLQEPGGTVGPRPGQTREEGTQSTGRRLVPPLLGQDHSQRQDNVHRDLQGPPATDERLR